jgi:hypothetical protein
MRSKGEGIFDEGEANDVPGHSDGGGVHFHARGSAHAPVALKMLPRAPEVARRVRGGGSAKDGGASESMVGRVGLEPTTNALKGRCSTN